MDASICVNELSALPHLYSPKRSKNGMIKLTFAEPKYLNSGDSYSGANNTEANGPMHRRIEANRIHPEKRL